MLTRSALIYLSRLEGLKDFATRFSFFKKDLNFESLTWDWGLGLAVVLVSGGRGRIEVEFDAAEGFWLVAGVCLAGL